MTDSSTIDYFFYHSTISNESTSITRLELPENNSDHYPVECTMKVSIDRAIKKPDRDINTQKVNWKKVDIKAYKLNLNELLSDFEITSSSISGLDNSVVKLNNILKQAAELAGPTKVKRMRKPKLVVWSPVIQQAIAERKAAFAKWKYGRQSNDPKTPLLIAKR